MKVAFWGIGILILGILGILLISLFGNIAVTNQLNYTTLKNAVDAAMNDSLDSAYFDAGFCLCTNREMSSGKWVFNDSSEYELVDIHYENGNEKCDSSMKNCKVLFGEYRIDKQVFSESVVRRFADVINNNKSYRIIIQDINEYPPKVSVKVISSDEEFIPTRKDEGGYDIVNQIDAIIETKGDIQVIDPPTENRCMACSTPTPTPMPTSTPTPTPTPTPVINNDYFEDPSDYWEEPSTVIENDSNSSSDSNSDSRRFKKVCKICASCPAGASVTNVHNANCIEASSCGTKFPCPGGTSPTSSSCTCEYVYY